MVLKERIKTLRLRHGLSQQRLADRLGVSQQIVASWETGRTQPGPYMISSLGRLFSVSGDYLLGLSDGPEGFPDTLAQTETGETVRIDGAWLSMAKSLRDNGISERDLAVLLEVYRGSKHE